MAVKQIMMGLAALVLFLGFAVYYKLWVIQYRISSVDAELLRSQFDNANREAMDESASWRGKYDEEKEKATRCEKELKETKDFFKNKVYEAASVNKNLEMIEKENAVLRERVKSLRQELETEKLNCSLQ